MLYNWNTAYFCSSYVPYFCPRLSAQVLTNAVQLKHIVFLFQLCSLFLFQTSITSINQCCTIGTQRISVPVMFCASVPDFHHKCYTMLYNWITTYFCSSYVPYFCSRLPSQILTNAVQLEHSVFLFQLCSLFLFQTTITSINQCCTIGTQRISVPVMFPISVPDFHHKY